MRITAKLIALGAALSVCGAALSAQAPTDTRPTLAVMYFDNGAIGPNHKDYDALTKGIGVLLTLELSKNGKIRVVERDQLEHVMAEQKMSANNQVSKETAVHVGKILGARHMIFGGFVIDPSGQTRLVARSVNVETSQIEQVESVDGKVENLMSLISQMAQKLNESLKLPELSKPMRDASIESAKKVPFQVAMLYSRALAAADGGDKGQAVTLLQKSLVQFPDYEPAKQELKKLEQK
ncbi:MAG: CsgG/HfaB family protein [Gemmatimonadota bacterium]|nr:CsgG/HfaB family protein [Gemmatimonadota bacterium]